MNPQILKTHSSPHRGQISKITNKQINSSVLEAVRKDALPIGRKKATVGLVYQIQRPDAFRRLK